MSKHCVITGSIGAGKSTVVDNINIPNVHLEPWGSGAKCKELKDFTDNPSGLNDIGESNTVVFQNTINKFYISLKKKI